MKNFLLLFSLPVICLMAVACTNNKQNISVLYVGGSANIDVRHSKSTIDSTSLAQNIAQRSANFERFLKSRFTSVKAINAADYTQELSDNYDVTIFDGKIPEIAPTRVIYEDGKISQLFRPVCLSPSYSRPTIFIAETGENIGRSNGFKSDWYCLCLDAQAHSFRENHPIFNGPWPVKMTLEKEPTPENALHYQYFFDQPLPDSVMMWRVQTKDYTTDSTMRIGMVSRPWGFEDCSESEYISSGVCAKTIDAVAIGRHANVMNWGFVADPHDMTPEARDVFANAIVYMAQFNQAPIVRKWSDRIATKAYIKEQIYLLNEDQYLLRKEWNPSLTLDQYLSSYLKKGYEICGSDTVALKKYLIENTPYFYGGEGSYNIVVDEDAKALKMENTSKEFLAKAIELVQSEVESERQMGERILDRYTLCTFTKPQEWKDWYEKWQDKIFFTQSGGWYFMVDQPNAPGNDYYEKFIAKAARKIECKQPTEEEPVVIMPYLFTYPNGTQSVIAKFRIAPGYHIYGPQQGGSAFTATKLELALPDGYTSLGTEHYAKSLPLEGSSTNVYMEEGYAAVDIVGAGEGEITLKFTFQCCNSQMCYPPVTKEYKVVTTLQLYKRGK